jgi:RimJ/RimL family protein N-acetyltransferase
MGKIVFIEGENVYLRPWSMDDLDQFHEWFNAPELRKWLMLPFPMSRLEEKEFMEKMMKSKEDVVLSIVLKDGDRLIGNIGLHQIRKVNSHAMLGVAIADMDMAGKGYGTEAIKLIVDHGFNTLNLHRIWLFTHVFNERAHKAYQKVGFKDEGIWRESLYFDGKYHDQHLMAILKQEWDERQ